MARESGGDPPQSKTLARILAVPAKREAFLECASPLALSAGPRSGHAHSFVSLCIATANAHFARQ
jgi:hypothetical protein